MKRRILDRQTYNLLGDGKGNTIAILDSGFTCNHPALKGVAIEEARSFVEENPLSDTVGHGTECTSIVVAQLDSGRQGVAPAVTLFIGQIINAQGKGSVEALGQALEWAISLNVDVVAIPSGRLGDHPQLSQLIEKAIAGRILIVAPVGNPYYGQKKSLYPAAYPGVISVGCEVYQECYQDWVHPPDVLMSVNGVPVCTSNRKWGVGTDTSHATMLTAGVACLLITQNQEANQMRSHAAFLRQLDIEKVSILKKDSMETSNGLREDVQNPQSHIDDWRLKGNVD